MLEFVEWMVSSKYYCLVNDYTFEYITCSTAISVISFCKTRWKWKTVFKVCLVINVDEDGRFAAEKY